MRIFQQIKYWWEYGHIGFCQLCGRFGVLLKSEHAHEECWLQTK